MKIGWDINDEHRLAFSVFDFKEDLMTVWQNLYHNWDEMNIDGTLTQRDYVLDYRYNSTSIPWLNISAKAYKTEAEYDRGYKTPIPLQYSNQDDRWGIKLQNNAYFSTFGIDHNLVTGMDYQNREEDALYERNNTISDFGSMPNEYKDFGFYIQDIMKYKDFSLTLGGRFDKFNRKLTKRAGAEDFSDSRFSPRVALSYTLFDTITLLAGYSESFRAPTPHETSSKGPLNPHYWYLPNKNLKSEIGAEYEVGLSINKQDLFALNDIFTFKAIYFNGKIKDMISLKKLPDLGLSEDKSPFATYSNVEDAKRHGYEIELNYGLNSWLIGGSYEHLRIYDEKTGEVLRAFANKINANLTYSPFYGLSFGAELNHWLKPYQNPKSITYRTRKGPVTYTYVDKAFTQVNFKTSWNVKNTGIKFLDNNLRINFGINNLFDKQYINAASIKDTSRVGIGRNVYLDFEMNF